MTDHHYESTIATKGAPRRHAAHRSPSGVGLRPSAPAGAVLGGKATDLRLEVSVEDRSATMVLRGEFDRATAPEFWSSYCSIRHRGVEHLVVDVTEVGFLDTAGLSAVAGAADELRSEGGDLVLAGPSRLTRKILDVTGLGDHVTVSPAVAGVEL